MFAEDSLMSQHLWIAMIIVIMAAMLAGYIDAIAGGAGLILLPALILVGFPAHAALGQEKFISTIGTIAAIKNFIKSRSIIWKIVPVGIIAALIGAYLGAKAVLWIPSGLVGIIIIIMLPIGLSTAFFKGKLKEHVDDSANIKSSIVAIFFTGTAVGFYDGFFGPGTGSLFIIALCLINRLNPLQASATSKIFNFSSNIGALIAFILAGKILFYIGIPMVVGSIIGNHIGSLHAIKTNGAIIKKILIITVTLMMITLAWRLLF